MIDLPTKHHADEKFGMIFHEIIILICGEYSFCCKSHPDGISSSEFFLGELVKHVMSNDCWLEMCEDSGKVEKGDFYLMGIDLVITSI